MWRVLIVYDIDGCACGELSQWHCSWMAVSHFAWPFSEHLLILHTSMLGICISSGHNIEMCACMNG